MTRPIIRAIIKPIIRGIKRAADTLLFQSDLQNSLIPAFSTGSGTPTYTGLTTKTVPDFEALIHTSLAGESRFKGARRVENLHSSDVSTWSANLATATDVTDTVPPPSDVPSNTRVYQISASGASAVFQSLSRGEITLSYWIKQVSASDNTFRLFYGSASFSSNLTATSDWVRYAETGTNGGGLCGVVRDSSNNDVEIYICAPQGELVDGQAITAPSEYVSNDVLSSPYHGANVDAVQYFNTLNGNTVSSNVVTEATGIPITDVGVELNPDPDFESAGSYTGSGADITVAGGSLRVANSAAAQGSGVNAVGYATAVGKSYAFSVGVNKDGTSGNPTFRMGVAPSNQDYYGSTFSVNGTATGSFVATTTTTFFTLFVGGSVAGEYSELSELTLKEQHYYADAKGPYGYMAEAAATNALVQSNDLSTTWGGTRSVRTQSEGIAPDGTNSANKVVDNSAGGSSSVQVFQFPVVVASAVDTTFSIHAKADGVSLIYLGTASYDAGAAGFTWFNLSTGAVGTTSSNHTAHIEALPNGWYRCAVTFQTTTDLSGEIKFGVADTDNSQIVPLDGTSSILTWEAQVETSSFPTSQISTTTTAVTRNADVLTYDDVGNISDTAGTAVCEASTNWDTGPAAGAYAVARSLLGRIIYNNSNESSAINRVYDGSTISISPTGTSRLNSPQAVASTWGTALTPYAPGTLLPDLTPASYDGTIGTGVIGISCVNTGLSQLSGTNRLFRIYSDEKSNAEVLALG